MEKYATRCGNDSGKKVVAIEGEKDVADLLTKTTLSFVQTCM